MKKVVVIIVCVLFILMLFSQVYAEPATEETAAEVAEETKSFDPTVYEATKNYEYDKFEKEWNTHAAYGKEYSDASIVFGLTVEGNTQAVIFPPYIYVWVREANNTNPKLRITGLQVLANDKVFSARKVVEDDLQSIILLDSNVGKELLKAITGSEEVDFKLIYDAGDYTDTITGDDLVDIKQLAQVILDNDAWAYIVDENGRDRVEWDKIISHNYPMEIKE